VTDQAGNLARKPWLLASLVALIVLLVFLPVLRNDFVNWDDDKNFLDNPNYRGLGWEQIHWMWTSHHMGHYIPVTWMTLGLDSVVWGMEPFGYHLTNLLWHAANAVLFYFIALALLQTSAMTPWAAFFTALLFAVHPLRVESVAWVTERRDVVSGFFYLCAILAYLAWCRSSERKYYGLALGSFAAAVMAKEMAVTLPAVLVLLDFYPLRRRAWAEKIPFFAVAAIEAAVAFYALSQEGLRTSVVVLGWPARFAITIYGLAFYLWKTVLPIHLGPFYALTAHRIDPRGLPYQLSAVAVLLSLAAGFLFRKRLPWFTAALVAYAITLSPVLGIFHNGQQITADRYSYLACLSWALVAGALLVRGGRVPIVPAATLVMVLAVLTWRQTETWRNSETLWTHALEVEPSFMAYNDLGMDLLSRGNVSASIEDFRRAIENNPEYEWAHVNLGGAMLELGNWDEAIHEFQIALQLSPGLSNAHNGWGYALMMRNKLDPAIEHFRIALQMSPGYEGARRNLDKALELKGK
jgi:tetratricopeptide (TPR) repeat protein